MLRRRAFTLIELLVVIAIVAILAAMLMPVISMVKEAAVRSTCASQMRQVGLGLLTYRVDFEGLYPMVYWGPPWDNWAYSTNQGRWQHHLEQFTETYKVFNCPTARKAPVNGAKSEVLDAAEGAIARGAARGGGAPGWCTCLTAYNGANWGRPSGWSNPGPMNESKAESFLKAGLATARLDRCPILFDGRWQNDGVNHQSVSQEWAYFPHRNLRTTVVFPDGHAESRVKADFTSWGATLQVRD